jgi:hypothetical protein
MTNDSKHTHVRDVFLERTTRPLLVACHDELVTSFLQPFTETKLERFSVSPRVTTGKQLTSFSTVPNKRGSSLAADPPE